MQTTISEVTTFQNCRRRWDFEATNRGNLTPKGGVTALNFGSLFHDALEIFLQGGDAHGFLRSEIAEIDTANEKFLSNLRTAPHMLDMVELWAKKSLFPKYKIVDTERRGFIHLNQMLPATFFGYKFDALLEDNSGAYWLLDWKTTARRKSKGDFLLYNSQAVSYQMAAEEDLDLKIEGIIFVYVYKKEPTTPVVTKGNTLSEKKIVTTERKVIETIEKRESEPTNYQSYLEDVRKSQVSDYVQDFYLRATQEQRSIFRRELNEVVNRMSDPDVLVYRNPGEQNCNMCPFQSPCEAEQLGVDIQHILDSEFEQREPRD